jgi:membrane protease YdiL (CAAX protease family)
LKLSVIWITTFGLGEETGWRGFTLPRLQVEHNALAATLILWAMWSLWHMPMFLYMYDARILVGWLLGLLAGSITFPWLFNSTGGSLLLTVIFHGLFNYATACTRSKVGLPGAVLSSLVIVGAFLVVVIFKPAHLAHKERVIAKAPPRLGDWVWMMDQS